ncbi:hypothetical protein [Roseomonas sp. 18066]|uniref:hypothetical protein n=1 Tax=Roseomonas sp. 18066 TaxID=2681412 RepID=UPI00135A071F|nr:hypothetical protein [Roseomonas sp. 18066]
MEDRSEAASRRPAAAWPDRSRIRAVTVGDAGDAVLALRVARDLGLDSTVTLVSPPGAAAWLGAPLFLAIIAAAEAEVPGVAAFAVLDCGAAPGLALAALGSGLGAVVLAPCPAFAQVAAAAAAAGTPLWPAPPPALALRLEPGRTGPAGHPPRENGAEGAIVAKVAGNTALQAKKIANWWGSAPGDSAGRLG